MTVVCLLGSERLGNGFHAVCLHGCIEEVFMCCACGEGRPAQGPKMCFQVSGLSHFTSVINTNMSQLISGRL